MLTVRRLPIKDPPIKLEPIIKLTGNFTVSFFRKLTLLLLELFCIPIISNKNKQALKVNAKVNVSLLLYNVTVLPDFSRTSLYSWFQILEEQ